MSLSADMILAFDNDIDDAPHIACYMYRYRRYPPNTPYYFPFRAIGQWEFRCAQLGIQEAAVQI